MFKIPRTSQRADPGARQLMAVLCQTCLEPAVLSPCPAAGASRCHQPVAPRVKPGAAAAPARGGHRRHLRKCLKTDSSCIWPKAPTLLY